VESIYKFVAKQRDSYRSDTIEITEGYDFSQYETLRSVEPYDKDRFVTGNKDDLEREKPFLKSFPSARTSRRVPRTSTPKTCRSRTIASPRQATPKPFTSTARAPLDEAFRLRHLNRHGRNSS
jgi:hypothetical protein